MDCAPCIVEVHEVRVCPHLEHPQLQVTWFFGGLLWGAWPDPAHLGKPPPRPQGAQGFKISCKAYTEAHQLRCPRSFAQPPQTPRRCRS